MLEPVLYIGIAQSIFGGIVIATRRPQLLADRFLAAWLFIIAIEMVLALLQVTVLDNLPYEIPFLVVPFVYGPFLYLYTKSMISEKPEWKWIELFHFLPFFLFLGLGFLFKNSPGETSLSFSWAHPGKWAKVIYEILIISSITTYSVLVFILLWKHRKVIREEFSYRSGRITLNWLLFVSIVIYVSYVLTFLSAGVQMIFIRLPFDPKIFSFTGLTLFSFAFSFYGYRQSGIYYDGEPEVVPIPNGISSVKYAKSGLKREDLIRYVEMMQDLMEKKKLYVNPELTLAEISEQLLIPRHHLTQALNTELGKNFYTYINELRVKMFMDRVVEPKYKDFTFLAIAFDCGFNSKSTFNSVFKKFTGFTPSEYLTSLGRTD